MQNECLDIMWAAMVAESMGQFTKLSNTKIGLATVSDWSILPTPSQITVCLLFLFYFIRLLFNIYNLLSVFGAM